MPETLTQPPEQEPPESPERIKMEKGLELARQIRVLQDKTEKTIEDYKKLLRLLDELNSLFEPEPKKREYKRGEILDHLEELSRNTGKKIKDAFGIHSQPDGTLAGRVQLEDGRGVPFKGNELLEQIGGKKIENAFDIHSQPDGTLAGRVRLEDERLVPFKGNELLEQIGGKKIKDASEIHSQPDGTLAGGVQLEDERLVSFFWDGSRVKIVKW